ncbi:hypothetical protein HHI36_022202 [Cryptolaemus montrouzieri]|uniref:Uncharacterized protein n=1 Tax=Cryptolaemus montrouzieri TaxID=559131 RepID=A0ABD2MZV4_9CUCU
MSKMNYGFTYLQGRKLAYQYAAALGIYPFSRNKFTDDDIECSEVTNRADPSQVPLIVGSDILVPGSVIAEDVETDQPQQVLSQFGASIPHNIKDNVTEADDVEINEPTIAVAHDNTNNAQIVPPAPSAIDSDATDAKDIEVDQPVNASTKSIDKSNKATTTLTSQLPPEIDHGTDKSAKTPTKNTNKAHVQTSRSSSAIESAANIDNLAKINRNTEKIRKKVLVTPEAVRPFPKATPLTRKKAERKFRKGENSTLDK